MISEQLQLVSSTVVDDSLWGPDDDVNAVYGYPVFRSCESVFLCFTFGCNDDEREAAFAAVVIVTNLRPSMGVPSPSSKQKGLVVVGNSDLSQSF